MTHKLLDHETQKIIYRSAVTPQKSTTPNHRLAPHGLEVSASSDVSDNKISYGSPLGPSQGSLLKQKTPSSGSEMIRIYLDPSLCLLLTQKISLGGQFLPPEDNGESHRAKVTRKVVELIDQENGHRIENINLILDIANVKVEDLISYN